MSSIPSPPRSPSYPSTPRTHTPRSTSGSSLAFSHPFAANAKATQSPPIYFKKDPVSPSLSRPRTPERTVRQPVQLQTPPADVPLPSRRRVSFAPVKSEEELWEEAVDTVITEVTGEIDLQNKNITSIPPIIADASKFVVLAKKELLESSSSPSRALDRTKSAPAVVFSPTTTGSSSSSRQPFGRSKTSFFVPNTNTNDHTEKPPRKLAEIQLLLGSNRIAMLPTELFRLKGLTVLSLRSNDLTLIPPAIAVLTKLEELNLSNNRIAYLPAEVTRLSALKKLSINANPLLPVPSPLTSSFSPRVLGPLKILHDDVVPSLREIALSVLLSEEDGESGQQTMLEKYYDLPLEASGCMYLPQETMDKINAALPARYRTLPATTGTRGFEQLSSTGKGVGAGGLLPSAPLSLSSSPSPTFSSPNKERYRNASLNPRFNSCPSPYHHPFPTSFVDHAEERLEWWSPPDDVVVVSDLAGGKVPVMWRGCSRGCLDWLEEVDGEGEDGEGEGEEEGWDVSAEDFELDP